MFLSKLAQLPGLPSMRLNTTHSHGRSKVSASASASRTESTTPSPTQSTLDTGTSAGGATSASDPDDYADTLATTTNLVPSATMKPKATTSTNTTPSSTARRYSRKVIDLRDRRASSRVRKPTAKAQALGSRRYPSPPPFLDTIVIEHTPLKHETSSTKEPLTTSPLPNEASEEARPDPKVPPSTPSTANPKPAKTPSPPQVAGQEAPVDAVETPSRRTSQRERKPTAKVLSESVTGQKRPATDDAPDAAPRKSARLSYSAARVPSKLRYSISAENSEADETTEVEKAPSPEVASPKKSKVIVLKSKRLAEVFGPPKPKPESKSPTHKRRSKRRAHRSSVNTEGATTKPSADLVDIPGSCNLFCLSPSSRLLAFAQIALEMPDEEDENEETIPGSVYDWRMYTQVWCQCAQFEQAKPEATDSAELARALMPNPVSEGTSYDPIDLTNDKTPDAELLSAPVNTILRASDAEKLSQLYTGSPNHGAGQPPNGDPATGGMRTVDEFVPGGSYRPPETYASPYEAPSRPWIYPKPPSTSMRRTYEERLQDDHNALTEIRKRAAARRISWTFNMTFDDIHALIMEAEDREQQLQQQAQYRQQVVSQPQNVTDRAYGYPEPQSSRGGFGVLLPPRASHQARRAGSAKMWRRAGLAPPPTDANGEAEVAQEHVTSNTTASNLSFVEESTPPQAVYKPRPSSSSRPKSSRFRVDPRGLRGESPGPGTIINMKEPQRDGADLRREAEGYGKVEKVRREFEKYQKRMDAERQGRWQRKDQERYRLNGHGHGHGHGQP